ncbi:hypothetical protein D0B54_09820 [Solimonas sp. K1W22B-7]|uniref:hypothetical protein n=1 Tax=Solimonas sp. K1W22B-7 TaxID=2303331 RepID=UPI000E3374AC|nr:hypothetical protein [Solimonas sp. K1W22B-7]AXQ28965.1 hypothetical protein D0B54_09820 [Solimonas sp. K1W22B-7]
MSIYFPDRDDTADGALPRRLPRHWRITAAVLLFAVLELLLSLHLATQHPWLGIDLVASVDGSGVEVAGVATDGPVSGKLHSGDRLLALRGGDRIAFTLRGSDLVEEPDYFNDYADYRAFFARQQRLAELLDDPQLAAQAADGRWQSLPRLPERPLADLPNLFWLQLLFAVAALSAGAVVVAIRPQREAWWYLATSLALSLVCATAAIYSTRELALYGGLFHQLSALNHLGGLLFPACAVAMLWNYPRPLGRPQTAWLFPAAALLIWCLHASQLLVNHDIGFRLQVMIAMAGFCYLAWSQWQRSATYPADRAALKWFLFSWVAGSGLFIVALFLPLMLRLGPLIPQGYLFGLLLPCYLCMPLGLTRYRLFDLDRGWFEAWALFFAACAVLVLDGLLMRLAGHSPETALVFALALTGWLFYPLRRMAWQRRQRERQASRIERYTQASALMLTLAPDTVPIQFWKKLLQTAFAPLQISAAGATVPVLALQDEGNVLALPASPGTESLLLFGAENGRRLFDPDDLKTAETLAGLFVQAMAARDAYTRGAEEERGRLRRELHEDLGARLLNRVHTTSDSDEAASSRAMLEEVRSLIDLLDHREFRLDECINEWQAQFHEQCDSAGIDAHVHAPPSAPAYRLTVVERSFPARILREAVNNALRHSRPTRLSLTLRIDGRYLSWVFEHDGLTHPVAGWRPSRGIRNIDMRVQDLKGSLEWQQPSPDRLRMELRFPLTDGGST